MTDDGTLYHTIGISILLTALVLCIVSFLCSIHCWPRLVFVQNHFGRLINKGDIYVCRTKRYHDSTTKHFTPPFIRVFNYCCFLLPKEIKTRHEVLVYQGKTLKYKLETEITKTSELVITTSWSFDSSATTKTFNNKEYDPKRSGNEIVLIEGDYYTVYPKGLEITRKSHHDHSHHKNSSSLNPDHIKMYKTFSISCLVCLETFTNGDELFLLKCYHGFHKQCIVACFMESHTNCPVCNADVGTTFMKCDGKSTELITGRRSYRTFDNASIVDM